MGKKRGEKSLQMSEGRIDTLTDGQILSLSPEVYYEMHPMLRRQYCKVIMMAHAYHFCERPIVSTRPVSHCTNDSQWIFCEVQPDWNEHPDVSRVFEHRVLVFACS